MCNTNGHVAFLNKTIFSHMLKDVGIEVRKHRNKVQHASKGRGR